MSIKVFDLKNTKIAILGLGYVGLPLTIEFSKRFEVIGFDIKKARIQTLMNSIDTTHEISNLELKNAKAIRFTDNLDDLRQSNTYIVTVPTPVDINKQPDLKPLLRASEMVGKVLKKGDVVIYESTVYPGATEEDCIPVLESISKLKFNEDFFVGYSPERINPGDSNRRVSDIIKVTSGSTPAAAAYIDNLYKAIIKPGTYRASSIKVAESAKIIENVQRDVNIALINEFFQIFNQMGINTNEVIEAASTKWNFMKLKPGLVGGHCIGVDPYYLLYKSLEKGYIADLMRTGREINDGMPSYLVNDFIGKLVQKKINPIDLHISLLGFTFKEDCSDIRNSQVFQLYSLLIKNGFIVEVFDPVADPEEVQAEYSIKINTDLTKISSRVAFLAVGHSKIIKSIKEINFDYCYDFKGLLTESKI